MSRKSDIQALISFAQSVELYAYRNRFLLRMEMEDFDAALATIERAIVSCEEFLKPDASATMRAIHAQNREQLFKLQDMLIEVMLKEQRGRLTVATTSF